MRQEKFKMERQGLIEIGDEVEITEYQSFMNYSYIIEPAVAMSGCYPNARRTNPEKVLSRILSILPEDLSSLQNLMNNICQNRSCVTFYSYGFYHISS